MVIFFFHMVLEEISSFINIPIISTLIGVIVGSVTVYWTSMRILQTEQSLKKKNIARAFLLEIKAIEKNLRPTLSDIFLNERTTPSIFNIEAHAINKLHWHYPFYDNYDLFSTSRMSIFILNEDLCEKLNRFYANLIIADDWRKNFLIKVDEMRKKSSNYMINSENSEEKCIEESYSNTIIAVKDTFKPINEIKMGLEEIADMKKTHNSVISTLKRELDEDISIYSSDLLIPVWLILGLISILSGAYYLNANPPIYQIGFPAVSIGFAFFTFGSNRYSGDKIQRKLDEIIKKG